MDLFGRIKEATPLHAVLSMKWVKMFSNQSLTDFERSYRID